MTYNTPSSTDKHHESTEPESRQMARMLFFLLHLLFFFFRRGISNLRDSFTMVFTQDSSIFHWAVYRFFLPVWSLMRRFEPLSEELWLPLWCHFFFFTYTHVHKSLNKEIWLLCKIAELEIQLVSAGKVWGEPGQSVILQPILHTSTEEACETDLLLCDRWQTSAQACICC